MNRAIRTFSGVVVSLGLVVAGAGFTSAPTTMPTPPNASASVSTWQTWAEAEQAYMQSTNWTQMLQSELGPEQQLVNWGLFATTSTGSGVIPEGISTDALWYSVRFTSGAMPSSASVMSTTYPSKCNSATDGEICVGQISTTETEVEYLNESSNSFVGHLELSLNSSQCAPGTTLANSPTDTFVEGEYFLVYPGVNYTQNVGTVWKGQSGGPYQDYGNVCVTP